MAFRRPLESTKLFARGFKCVLLLLIAGPIFWAAVYAVIFSLGGFGRLSNGWTVQHWLDAFQAPTALRSLAFSAFIAALTLGTTFSLTVGALMIRPELRDSRSVLLAAVVVMGTPALVIGQMVSQLMGPGGWLSRLAFHTGLIDSPNDFPIVVNDTYHISMLFSMTLTVAPLCWLYFSQLWGTAQLDRTCQVAQSLGASHWQARTQVALPILIHKARSMIILLFILVLGSFEIPLLLGRQSPQMLSVATQQLATKFDLTVRPQAFVLATLYMLSISLMLVLFLRGRRADATKSD